MTAEDVALLNSGAPFSIALFCRFVVNWPLLTELDNWVEQVLAEYLESVTIS